MKYFLMFVTIFCGFSAGISFGKGNFDLVALNLILSALNGFMLVRKIR